ncbi:MAG: hypothetical protein IH786_12330 [Proteobacteria bacterium]|nr:hypothetical protein [Pseudomonadota bacterium]
MLIGFRDFEVREDNKEDKQVINTEGFLDEVTGEKFEGAFGHWRVLPLVGVAHGVETLGDRSVSERQGRSE